MGVSKVILNGDTLMDVTQDTVASSNLLSGETATGADGESVIGTYIAPVLNPITKTAIPSEDEQIITAGTQAATIVNAGSWVQHHAGGTSYSSNAAFSTIDIPLVDNAFYRVIGTISVKLPGTDNPVEIHNVDARFQWAMREQRILTVDDENAYIGHATLYKYSATTHTRGYGPLKAETFAVGFNLVFLQIGDYDVLDKVTIAPIPNSYYSPSVIEYFTNRLGAFKEFSLPEGQKGIGAYAFRGCSGLATLGLPNSITSIDQYAFYGCTALALTSLPGGITTIGQYAFYGCTALALTSLPNALTVINTYTFYRCTSLALTSLPSTITSIGSYAFYECTGLTHITCTGPISTLSSSAFLGASGYLMQLESARFPNAALSSVGTVFGSTTSAAACQHLAEVDLGASGSIEANAFYNCYALQTVVLRKTGSVCTLSNVSAFYNTPLRGYTSLTGTVYVPSALIATYKTATNWSTLFNAGTVEFAAIEGSEWELS